ncbi:MAG: alpha/beta fold hydrolase [Chitinophagaceae bacterium]
MRNLMLAIIYLLSAYIATAQFAEELVAIKTSSDSLRGVLLVPANTKTFSLVIIVPGSGPTDRNGNNPLGVTANSYRMLATALANQQIACLLFDKRGIAASKTAMVAEDSLRFDTYVQDLQAWIAKLKTDKRVKKIIVAGHSEGSLVGMLAAQRSKTDGYISLEGPANSIDKIIMQQVAAQPEKIQTEIKSIFNNLRDGKKPDSVPPYLMSLFRPGIQAYMQSWMQYSPCNEIKKLSIPVLIVQGTTDIQVNEEEGKKLAACNPAAIFKLISGMNHVLKNSSIDRNENMASYRNTTLPVNEELITAITTFVKNINP